VVSIARPKKLPTKVVRIGKLLEKKLRMKAKTLGMSFPDYLDWRLSR